MLSNAMERSLGNRFCSRQNSFADIHRCLLILSKIYAAFLRIPMKDISRYCQDLWRWMTPVHMTCNCRSGELALIQIHSQQGSCARSLHPWVCQLNQMYRSHTRGGLEKVRFEGCRLAEYLILKIDRRLPRPADSLVKAGWSYSPLSSQSLSHLYLL